MSVSQEVSGEMVAEPVVWMICEPSAVALSGATDYEHSSVDSKMVSVIGSRTGRVDGCESRCRGGCQGDRSQV